jgi:hypothetical protein
MTTTHHGDTRTLPGSVVGACGATAALAVVAAAIGLFQGGGPGQYDVSSIRGDVVTLYGEGLYRYDTFLIGAGNRGQDLVTLLVEVPLLVLALLVYRRGKTAAGVLLCGLLAYFVYYYASMTFATAQNRLFPAYVGAFVAALYAFVRVFASVDMREVAERFPARPSRRILTGYLVAVAVLLTAVWLPPLVISIWTGDMTATAGPYTSSVTTALDLGIVVPVVLTAAVLLHRARPLGYLLTLVVIILNVAIGLLLIGQGAAQLLAGVPLTTGEIVGKMLSFAFLTLVAGGLLGAIVRADRR